MGLEINKMMLKGLMKLISPEQIDEAIKGITDQAIQAKRNYPLEKDESLHAIMIYEVDNTPFFTIAIIKDTEPMIISRFVETQKLSELITTITQKI